MKRICFIGGYGGGASCVERLCGPQRLYVELAQRLKNEYSIFFVNPGNEKLQYTVNNIQGVILERGPLFSLTSLKTLQKINPSVIHGHGSLNMGVLLWLYKKVLGKKTILTFTDFKKNITSNYRLLNALDKIIVQTEHARIMLIRKGVKSSKIEKITYGVEESFYTAKENKTIRKLGKKIVLYYGDARTERGFHILLKALLLLNNDISVLLCLRKFEKGFSLARIRAFPRQNATVLTVPEYPCPIQDIIKSVDLVVLPFVKNTLEPPLTIMEVSAVGTPLVVTNVGGNKEVAAAGAYVINKIDSRVLAETINTALKRKKSVKRKRYDWDVVLEEIKGIYDS